MIHKTIKVSKNSEGKLTTYILDGERRRPAVLILPGGGYFFTSANESEQIAMQFTSRGYHSFVLHYSVSPYRHPTPLFDASNAMCIIRENADKWQVDTEKIAVCGFSAGGHLTASLGVFWHKDFLNAYGKNKPNALILAYPVITADEEFTNKGSFDNLLGKEATYKERQSMSLEKHISKLTPPTFLWHTMEDEAVPMENSVLFAMGLRKKGYLLSSIFIHKGRMVCH